MYVFLKCNIKEILTWTLQLGYMLHLKGVDGLVSLKVWFGFLRMSFMFYGCCYVMTQFSVHFIQL